MLSLFTLVLMFISVNFHKNELGKSSHSYPMRDWRIWQGGQTRALRMQQTSERPNKSSFNFAPSTSAQNGPSSTTVLFNSFTTKGSTNNKSCWAHGQHCVSKLCSHKHKTQANSCEDTRQLLCNLALAGTMWLQQHPFYPFLYHHHSPTLDLIGVVA